MESGLLIAYARLNNDHANAVTSIARSGEANMVEASKISPGTERLALGENLWESSRLIVSPGSAGGASFAPAQGVE